METSQPTIQNYDIYAVNPANLSKLDLNATEGFVLSQLDGSMTVSELKQICNIRETELLAILDKLIKTRAVFLKGRRAPAAKSQNQKQNFMERAVSFEDRVRAMYLELDALNFYQLLGARQEASAEEIKKAFYKMTKEFHPDRFFRGEDVEVRNRLQAIFARINDAYRTLTNPKTRRDYDNQIAARKKGELGDPASNQNAAPKKNPFMDAVLKAKRLYEGAMLEIKRKNFASAKQNLRIAISLDPFNKRYPQAILDMEKNESIEQALKYFKTGLEYESGGQYKEAARLYREAMLLDSDNELYYTRLARIVLEQDKNPDAAKKLIQKAMELKEGNPDHYLLLGMIFRDKGQTTVAIAQYDKGLKLDPNHKELQKEMKKAKKGK